MRPPLYMRPSLTETSLSAHTCTGSSGINRMGTSETFLYTKHSVEEILQQVNWNQLLQDKES
jgi:hypothetical protein